MWPKQPEGTEYRALHLRSTEKTFKTKRNGASVRIKICVSKGMGEILQDFGLNFGSYCNVIEHLTVLEAVPHDGIVL